MWQKNLLKFWQIMDVSGKTGLLTMQSKTKKIKQFNHQLCQFIDQSPTPFHACANMLVHFKARGYTHLQETDDWRALSAGNYVITRNDSSLIALKCPASSSGKPLAELLAREGIHMTGAHTDSPCLKLKPNAVIHQDYLQLGVEVYGGALLNPWFDRDLSLAGQVGFVDNKGQVQQRLIDFKRPIAVIPSLAIHLDRNANKERSINAQTDIVPILAMGRQTADNAMPPRHGGNKKAIETHNAQAIWHQVLIQQLSKQYPDLEIQQIASFELSFYAVHPAQVIGLEEDFISSARLDNLLSCYIAMRALTDSDPDTDRPALCVFNDHEEIGSQTLTGAQGNFLTSVLQRLCGDNEQLAQCMHKSLLVSADNAHGIHPNYADRHDSRHGPLLNHGVVVKINANQRYATNSQSLAQITAWAAQKDIPLQKFVMRTDMGCGSTIGPLLSASLGVNTIDLGIATFAMHSIREICGSFDPYLLYQLLLYYNKQ